MGGGPKVYPINGDIDPITNRMDAVRRALLTDRASAGRYGVTVEVGADGTLAAVRIDESVTPYGAELGKLITDLAREALAEARANVRARLAEFTEDPRIEAVRETLHTAVERPYPTEPQPLRRPVPVKEDELTEEELIELNEQRNRSFFR
ncbi:YbaB/EbfC family nucleoid-associated protein [Nocardia gipuzkoensis]